MIMKSGYNKLIKNKKKNHQKLHCMLIIIAGQIISKEAGV